VRRLLARTSATTFVRSDLRAAALPWITARLIVIAGLGVSRFAFDQVGKPPRPTALRQGLFAWDAAFYRSIATHGYDGLSRAALRFFPLVPALAKALGVVFFSRYGVALIVIANASALVFAALLHRIALLETGDAHLARRAAWFGAVFPPSRCSSWATPTPPPWPSPPACSSPSAPAASRSPSPWGSSPASADPSGCS